MSSERSIAGAYQYLREGSEMRLDAMETARPAEGTVLLISCQASVKYLVMMLGKEKETPEQKDTTPRHGFQLSSAHLQDAAALC